MTVHPVLECLKASYPLYFDNDNAASFYTFNWRKEIHSITVCTNDADSNVELHYTLSLRCTLSTERTKMYIKALQAKLDADYIGLFEHGHSKIDGLILCSKDNFPDESPESIAEYIESQIRLVLTFFETFAMVARLCVRLQDRGGTEQYKKLLPSKLAELTLCGLDMDDARH